MFHPLDKDYKDIPTQELENKLTELRTKYLRATNPQVRNQINMFIAGYTEELKMRWYQEQKEIDKNSGKDIDDLIKVD
jgi:hypothetical protein|tara:strand:- start:1536 stop:1769 length:234 start_codon:yes stop_codon:yes gene_type:complete